MKEIFRGKRLLLSALGLVLTIVIVCQASPNGWNLSGGSRTSSDAGNDRDRGAAAARILAEGRLVSYPGAEVIVGAELGGRIVRLPIEEKSVVKKGDLIAELQSDDLRASLEEAKAHAEEAEADIWYCKREVDRARRLSAPNAGAQLEWDNHQRGLLAARAAGTPRPRARPTLPPSSPRPISFRRLTASCSRSCPARRNRGRHGPPGNHCRFEAHSD